MRLWISLDVHKHSIVATTLPAVGGMPELQRIENTQRAIRRFIDRVGSPDGLAVSCGISTRTALGLLAEIGDFRRFGSARKLMSYLGLTPSEYSSGDQQNRGHITKSGNQHARRLLVEAAWHYRRDQRTARLADRVPADVSARLANTSAPASPPPHARPARQALDRHQRRRRARTHRLRLGRDDAPAPARGGHSCLNTVEAVAEAPRQGARRHPQLLVALGGLDDGGRVVQAEIGRIGDVLEGR